MPSLAQKTINDIDTGHPSHTLTHIHTHQKWTSGKKEGEKGADAYTYIAVVEHNTTQSALCYFCATSTSRAREPPDTLPSVYNIAKRFWVKQTIIFLNMCKPQRVLVSLISVYSEIRKNYV